MTRWMALATLTAAAASASPQQIEPPSLSACLAQIETLPRQSASQKPEIAAKCAAQSPLASTHGADFLVLAKLYAEADQFENSRKAIAQRLAEPKLEDSGKAEALLTMILAAQRGSRTDELRPRSIRAAEEVAPQIDRLGESAVWQQLMVYRWLNSYYRGDPDENGKVHKVASRYMELYGKLGPAHRKDSEAAFGLYCAYENLAGVYSTHGDTPRAMATLREGIEKVPSPQLSKSLQKGLLHYELVGKTAPPLTAATWINPPTGNKIAFDGKVTVLEFTAHWCIPCKETYPSLLSLDRKFAGRGVQVLLATSLYGYFGKDHDLSPEQELALDRKYFIDEHKLPFPVAIANRSADDGNSQNYGVQTIPLIVVIDRQGVVRRFLMGVTPSEEATLSTLLEELLTQ